MSRPIEIRVPGKVVLLGEWGVTAGHLGIAAAVAADLNLTWTPGTAASGLQLSGGGHTERFATPEALASFAGGNTEIFLTRAARLLSQKGFFASGRFHIETGWPSDFGLGSSSATVAALLAALEVLAHSPAEVALDAALEDADRFVKEVTQRRDAIGALDGQTRRKLWLEGRRFIREFDGPKASGLDLAAQLTGGAIALRGDHFEAVRIDLPVNLRLIHTRQKISTREKLASFEPEGAWLEALGRSAEEFLRHRDWPRAIREHEALLRQTPLVPDEVRAFADDLKRAGIIEALKTTGAGGGDALLAWVAAGRESELEAVVTERGWRLGLGGDGLRGKGLEIA